MSKKIKCVFILMILALAAAFAQQTAGAAQAQTTDVGSGQVAERLSLAISSLDYPVTSGDIYRLSYRQSAGTMVNTDVQVDGVGVMDLAVFGKIDTSGMIFVELKQRVEEVIAKNYTFSMPKFTIVAPGVFRVSVRDGASRIQYSTAWGLSRLSEVVAEFYTSQSSLRNVELISRNGDSKRYDLLKAALSNERDLDPLVRQGDTIMLHSPGRVIQLLGEVRRPGFYELLEEEGLKHLVEILGGGLSSQADATRVRIDRSTEQGERSDYISIPSAYLKDISLLDGDIVLVRARAELRSLVWFEGAVSNAPVTTSVATAANAATETAGTTGTSPGAAVAVPGAAQNPSGRFSYPIREGQMLSDILQDIRSAFLPLADLDSAVFFNLNSEIGLDVDIQSLLSGTDMSTDIPLSAGCRIFIPSISNTVMVSGAVFAPSSVPFRFNSSVPYYLNLAGGADPERNFAGSYVVYDQNGKKKKASSVIQPGDRIHVLDNNFNTVLERRIALLASIVTLTLSTLTLIDYFRYWEW